MTTKLPYDESFKLGKGFNSVKGIALGTIFLPGIEYSDAESGAKGQEVIFNMHRIEDYEQLYKELGVSVEASGRYGLFAASAKFNFAQESNFNSYSVFYLLSVRVRNAVKHINNYQLNPEVIRLLEDGKTEQFRKGYGDSYIESFITGGEFFALYEFICTDETTKSQISAELDAKYGAAMLTGVEINAKFTSIVTSATQKRQLKLTTHQAGGVGVNVVTTPEEMLARAKEFPSIVQGDKGVAYEVIIQSYETLPLPDGPNYIDIENKKYVLDNYAKDIIKYRQKLAELDYIMQQPEEFEFEDKTHIETVVKQRVAVGNIIKSYTAHASKCADSITDCEVFTPAEEDLSALNFCHFLRGKKRLIL